MPYLGCLHGCIKTRELVKLDNIQSSKFKTCHRMQISIENYQETIGNYLNGSYDKICKERETDEVLSPTDIVGTLRCIYSVHGNR